MKRLNIYLVILAGFLLVTDDAFAGAWTQRQGHGFYKMDLRIIRADEFYEPNGNKTAIPTLGEYTFSFYGEYGLNDWLTAVAYVPYLKRITLNSVVFRESGEVNSEGDSKTGVSDLDVGVRVGFLQGGATVLSAGLLFGLPIGDENQASGLLTGDGEFNQLLSLQLGHAFHPIPMYFSVEVGFNNRSNGYSDEFHYRAEFGYAFGNKFTLILRSGGVESFKNGDDAVTGGLAGLFANNQRVLSYGPELIYNLNHAFGISAAIEGATRGQNVLSAPAYSLGLLWKM